MSDSEYTCTSPANRGSALKVFARSGHEVDRRGVRARAIWLPLLLIGMLFGSGPAFAVTPLPVEPCPSNLNSCTAGDVITTVVASDTIGNDDCTDGFLDVEWTFEFATTANQRYDLGVFVALDGGTVQEPSTAEVCAGATPEPGVDGDPPTPFDDNDGDMCGDLSTASGPVQWTVSQTVACADFNAQGQLFVNSCRVWQQNAQTECNDLAAAGTGSKCDCTPLTLQVDPCSLVTCDDNNVCTTDSCDDTSGSAVCDYTDISGQCDDGNACTADSCDPATGCVNTDISGQCDDGNACTADSCDPATGCVNTDISGTCDDGNACTADSCDPASGCVNDDISGQCDDGNACTADSCDPASGCVNDDISSQCDDGNACTADSCDPASGCVNDDISSQCDDGAWCNGAETCDPNNGCQAGTAPNCDDGVSCTNDSCDEDSDSCVNAVDDTNCDDGAWCNGAEFCDPVNDCQAGTAPNCDDGVSCTNDSCDEDSDSCVNEVDNSNCDDGAWCNGAEVCDATLDCQAGTAPNCDDGVSCTNDSCNDDTDSCDNIPDDSLCNNGLFCDGTETCDATSDCQAGTPPDCSSFDDQCNDGVCDDGIDACKADPKPNSTPCEDGVACTSEDGTPQEPDHCIGGVCTGMPVDCDDGGSCNGEETCNTTSGACEPDPSGFVCEEICVMNGGGKAKPPKGLEWQYVNTDGNPDFDSVCITAEHPQGALAEDQPYKVDDGEFFTTTRPGGNNRKLNPQVTFQICAQDGSGGCSDDCDESFIVHTSCSLPLGIGQAFPDAGTHDIIVSGQTE